MLVVEPATWDGVLGLLGGVVGALAAFFAAYMIIRSDRRERRRLDARTAVFEWVEAIQQSLASPVGQVGDYAVQTQRALFATSGEVRDAVGQLQAALAAYETLKLWASSIQVPGSPGRDFADALADALGAQLGDDLVRDALWKVKAHFGDEVICDALTNFLQVAHRKLSLEDAP